MSAQHLDFATICRRAGGRRHYNSMRHLHAVLRRQEVVRWWDANIGRHGWQAEAARALGVHRSTISRDVAYLLDQAHRTRRCPLCRQDYRPGPWHRAAE